MTKEITPICRGGVVMTALENSLLIVGAPVELNLDFIYTNLLLESITICQIFASTIMTFYELEHDTVIKRGWPIVPVEYCGLSWIPTGHKDDYVCTFAAIEFDGEKQHPNLYGYIKNANKITK